MKRLVGLDILVPILGRNIHVFSVLVYIFGNREIKVIKLSVPCLSHQTILMGKVLSTTAGDIYLARPSLSEKNVI